MSSSKCLVCGSSNLRADRALSGRLICTSCGNPYGVRKVGSNKLNNLNFSSNKKNWLFIFLLIFAFIIVIL